MITSIRAPLALLIAAVLCAPAAAENWQYMGNLDAYAGQYFFQNGAGSVNGYATAQAQQMKSLSSASGFYFNESSVYTGFKQVDELAGGGTLFQQSWDNSAAATWISRFDGGYSLKPHAGLTQEMYRETNDEAWGNGLYDYWRYNAGLTFERKTRLGLSVPWTYQFSYDAYYTHYPHFTTLASQFGAALGAPNPGAHTLDTITNQLSYRSDFDLPGFASVWGLYSLSLVSYPDQNIVDSQDNYIASKRADTYQYLNLGGTKRLTDWDMGSWGRVRPFVGMSLSFDDLFSNQNNFDDDPAHLQYTPGYFNYWEGHLSPNVALTFLKPMLTTRLGYDIAYRAYTSRQTQDASGGYTGGLLHQYIQALTLDVAYPIVGNLELKARGIWSLSRANTQYEQTYVYNYKTYNYFVGLGWKL